MTTHGYLYLLIDAEHPRFKIGVSEKPEIRVFGMDQKIDPLRSVKYRFAGRAERGAERMLHFLFRAQNVETEWHPGYREWFDLSALPAVEAFMRQHRDRIGWLDVAPLGPVRLRPKKEPRPTPPPVRYEVSAYPRLRPAKPPSNYVLGQRRRFAREAAERLARQ
jgi:hypothetical protein